MEYNMGKRALFLFMCLIVLFYLYGALFVENSTASALFMSRYFSSGVFSEGVFSAGNFSIGFFSMGVFSIGIFSVGVFSVGLFSIGVFNIAMYGMGLFLWCKYKKYPSWMKKELGNQRSYPRRTPVSRAYNQRSSNRRREAPSNVAEPEEKQASK